ncbi:hypothetical protein R1flu_017515 [Riccia fluitans]|uniref:LAGLIDADG homing endonuclease n=1 Tax=Riccia fluitans TaxID=41844 RepID=A0ABD1ZE90_9MARC
MLQESLLFDSRITGYFLQRAGRSYFKRTYSTFENSDSAPSSCTSDSQVTSSSGVSDRIPPVNSPCYTITPSIRGPESWSKLLQALGYIHYCTYLFNMKFTQVNRYDGGIPASRFKLIFYCTSTRDPQLHKVRGRGMDYEAVEVAAPVGSKKPYAVKICNELEWKLLSYESTCTMAILVCAKQAQCIDGNK